jgi:8-oxo-dGTP diphosphatase
VRVVAAAIMRDAAVLAARRTRPDRLAGGWEFPGGKVEPGEDERAALARECLEELSVRLQVGDRLGAVRDGDVDLVLYAATVVAGEPTADTDHDALAWLAADELHHPAWLPIDRALLGAVRAKLEARTP